MNESKSYQVIGYGLAILQAVLYSMLGIFGKLIYATGLNAQQAVILRFLAATVILGAFMLIRRKEAMVSRQPSVYLQAIGSGLIIASIAVVTIAPMLKKLKEKE